MLPHICHTIECNGVEFKRCAKFECKWYRIYKKVSKILEQKYAHKLCLLYFVNFVEMK